jgi:hypothetical protein
VRKHILHFPAQQPVSQDSRFKKRWAAAQTGQSAAENRITAFMQNLTLRNADLEPILGLRAQPPIRNHRRQTLVLKSTSIFSSIFSFLPNELLCDKEIETAAAKSPYGVHTITPGSFGFARRGCGFFPSASPNRAFFEFLRRHQSFTVNVAVFVKQREVRHRIDGCEYLSGFASLNSTCPVSAH